MVTGEKTSRNAGAASSSQPPPDPTHALLLKSLPPAVAALHGFGPTSAPAAGPQKEELGPGGVPERILNQTAMTIMRSSRTVQFKFASVQKKAAVWKIFNRSKSFKKADDDYVPWGTSLGAGAASRVVLQGKDDMTAAAAAAVARDDAAAGQSTGDAPGQSTKRASMMPNLALAAFQNAVGKVKSALPPAPNHIKWGPLSFIQKGRRSSSTADDDENEEVDHEMTDLSLHDDPTGTKSTSSRWHTVLPSAVRKSRAKSQKTEVRPSSTMGRRVTGLEMVEHHPSDLQRSGVSAAGTIMVERKPTVLPLGPYFFQYDLRRDGSPFLYHNEVIRLVCGPMIGDVYSLFPWFHSDESRHRTRYPQAM